MIFKRKTKLLNAKEAAKVIGLSPSTLQSIRYGMQNPIPYRIIKGRIFYRLKDCLKAQRKQAKYTNNESTKND